MDDIVKQAMAKWPNVPAVYGWLGLDRRGNWLVKGDRVANPVVAEFIGRNYERDADGRWFFQNGPQRVYATCDYTPLVYRIAGADNEPLLEAHTGRGAARVTRAWIDDGGIVLVETELGPGMIDDRDLDRLLPRFTDKAGATLPEETVADAIENLQSGHASLLHFCYPTQPVPVLPLKAMEAPEVLGYIKNPEPPPDHEPCA